MVVLWKDLVVVVVLEKIKERVKVVVEFWSLWWIKWRWRRKKKMIKWCCYCCCCSGDEVQWMVIRVLTENGKERRRKRGLYLELELKEKAKGL